MYSCDPTDDEEATAFPSEEDEAMREWRQEFPEQTRRAIIRIHTNLGHPQNSTLAKMVSDAGGSEEMIKYASRYPCSVCKRMSRPRLRRPVSVPRTRQFNDTLLADVHFWNYQGREVLVYSLIDEATRFHVTQIVPSQSAPDLYEAIMNAWVKWAGAPRFLLVDPRRSHLARQFIEHLGALGTTVLVGAAEASWTRGLVERHGAYVRSMVEKMVHDGVPDDMSAQSLFDKATSAKNMMSRIRGYTASQWVLATQPRIPESLMIDDEDEDHVPHKDIPESQDDEFARSVRVRDAARRAFIAVVDYGGRIFKQAAEQLSHVTARERLAQEAVRESRNSDRNMDHVSDEPELLASTAISTSRTKTECGRTCARTIARCFDACT